MCCQKLPWTRKCATGKADALFALIGALVRKSDLEHCQRSVVSAEEREAVEELRSLYDSMLTGALPSLPDTTENLNTAAYNQPYGKPGDWPQDFTPPPCSPAQ